MANTFELPKKKSVLFWPIGTGDSTTLVLRPGEIAMQIDLRHLEKADDPDEAEWPIIDYLVKSLPKRSGKPYLALFVLTHPDKDHIQGFGELLKKVHIGEIWHTPRIFLDQSDEESLCDDAKLFQKEVERRRKAIIDNSQNIVSGNRLRVIGHDDILNEDDYKGLPNGCKSRPGEIVSMVDGTNLSSDFRVFIHAPFKEDLAKDKNNTSLSLNVVLIEGEKYAQFFFFGDREYQTLKQIFETTEANKSNTGYLYWDVLLSPHHCSKSAMYAKEEGEEKESFKKDIMNFFEKYNRNKKGYIVSSSHSDFSDGEGDNPPHKKARNRYEAIVESGHFLCTHEYPSKKEPAPIIFSVDKDKGFEFDDKREKGTGPSGLAAIVAAARGGTKPPGVQVGFGSEK